MDNKGIFVSYRREETTPYAGWLADRLADHFGREKVFRDIGSIGPGVNFVEAIERALRSCAVMLVVIGRSWTTALAKREQSGEADYTRLEVSTALKRADVRVMPVLVQGASMPRASELPDNLVALTHRTAMQLHDTNWESDVGYLIAQLEDVVARVPETGTIRVERKEDDFGNRRTLTLFVDGEEISGLASGQYIDVELEPGPHRVEVRIPPMREDPATSLFTRLAPDAVESLLPSHLRAEFAAAERHITVRVYRGEVYTVVCGVYETSRGGLSIEEEFKEK